MVLVTGAEFINTSDPGSDTTLPWNKSLPRRFVVHHFFFLARVEKLRYCSELEDE